MMKPEGTQGVRVMEFNRLYKCTQPDPALRGASVRSAPYWPACKAGRIVTNGEEEAEVLRPA